MTLPERHPLPLPPSAHDGRYAGHAAAPTGRKRGIGRLLLACFLVVLMSLSGLLLLASLTDSTGVTGFLIGTCLALLPLPVVLAAYRWLDRYEPEPKALLAFAFFWGATVGALVASILNTVSSVVVARTSGPEEGMAFTAVVTAPVVEEAVKAAAVVAIFLFRRREFDGIVDGIVFAGMVGIGFAFTENILYFGRAFLAGSEDLGVSGGFFAVGVTFVLRGVLAPFAHPLFTTMTGIGLGIAANRRHGPLVVIAPLVGYLGAVALHATWNFASLSGLAGFLVGYVAVMVPAFAIAIAVATWSRRREGRTLAAELPAYVDAGWLAAEDVPMLASLTKRQQALSWVRGRYGEGSSQALSDFQHAATELAFLRHRAQRGHAGDDFPEQERALLAEVARTRAAVQPG